jgi:hypothetical protein
MSYAFRRSVVAPQQFPDRRNRHRHRQERIQTDSVRAPFFRFLRTAFPGLCVREGSLFGFLYLLYSTQIHLQNAPLWEQVSGKAFTPPDGAEFTPPVATILRGYL